jgi:hypothetical protein
MDDDKVFEIRMSLAFERLIDRYGGWLTGEQVMLCVQVFVAAWYGRYDELAPQTLEDRVQRWLDPYCMSEADPAVLLPTNEEEKALEGDQASAVALHILKRHPSVSVVLTPEEDKRMARRAGDWRAVQDTVLQALRRKKDHKDFVRSCAKVNSPLLRAVKEAFPALRIRAKKIWGPGHEPGSWLARLNYGPDGDDPDTIPKTEFRLVIEGPLDAWRSVDEVDDVHVLPNQEPSDGLVSVAALGHFLVGALLHARDSDAEISAACKKLFPERKEGDDAH